MKNLEQRQSRISFYKRNGFKTAMLFLEYRTELEILYRVITLTKELIDIFRKLREKLFRFP